MTTRIPADLIPVINRMVRTSRQLFVESGHEPSVEELAARLAMPLAKVEKLAVVAGLPIRL